MKRIIALAVIVTFTFGTSTRAESELSTELQKLQNEYKTTVQTALAPINNRHALALQALLERANQSNDTLAAREALLELRKLGAAATQYVAKCSFEFSPSNEINAEQVLRNNLMDDPFSTLSPVRNRTGNTGLFELFTTAADPKFAADRANDLVRALQSAVARHGTFPPIKIWEKAEPPAKPLTVAAALPK